MLKILLAIFLLIPAAYAQEPHEDIAIKVNGMVCDFCAQSVWKVFEDYDGVEKVDIDLDTGMVTVHMKPDQTLSEDDLKKAITFAGYDLVSIERQSADHS